MTHSLLEQQASRAVGRRAVMVGAAALGLLPLLGASGSSGAITRAGTDPADRDTFFSLSTYLTGRQHLDEATGLALLAALHDAESGLSRDMAALRSFVSTSGLRPEAIQAVLDAGSSPLAALPATIVGAWYLGVVGHGADARCVTYTGALSNMVVGDVLTPPSYAFGPYGSWSAKPLT